VRGEVPFIPRKNGVSSQSCALRSCHRDYGLNFHTVPSLSLPPSEAVP